MATLEEVVEAYREQVRAHIVGVKDPQWRITNRSSVIQALQRALRLTPEEIAKIEADIRAELGACEVAPGRITEAQSDESQVPLTGPLFRAVGSRPPGKTF